MKIILTEEQINNVLLELTTKKKEIFGMGVEHQIYNSNKNPNIVFKLGHPYVVDRWLKIFKKFPLYFPKTYRVGDIRFKNNVYRYVEMDKLNTSRVKDEWKLIEDKLVELDLTSADLLHNLSDIFRNCIMDEEYDNMVIQKLQKSDKVVYHLFMKWLNFLHSLNTIIKMITDNMLDIHDGNFGYDKKGNIKCFDI